MGCGCRARRPVRSVVKASSGILKAVASAKGKPVPAPEPQALSEERRKVEKLRRDAILRALGRP